jgi:hypothetical protein
MRTTVTLDPDVERTLREAMRRSRQSFKATLNQAIRAGLEKNLPRLPSAPFVVTARPLGLRPGFDPAGFNRLADELEADAVREKQASERQS